MRPHCRRRKVRSTPFPPAAKTTFAPLHPKGTSAPTSWAWARLLSPPRGARRGPHIWSYQKEYAPRPVEKKKCLAALRHLRASALYGSRREMVPAGLRWISDGRGGVRCGLDGGFPRRGCVLERGAGTHLTCSSFPVSRCGAPSISVTSVPLVPPSARSALPARGTPHP